VLGPYKDALKNLPKSVPVVFAGITIKNGWDIKERVDFAFKSLTRLYELKIFGKRKWKEIKKAFFEELKEYRRNLKAKGVKAKKIRRKVRYQIKLFKEFVRRYKNLPNAEKLKFGQIVSALWVFELTYNPEEGYHPHWHGLVLTRIPKVLLTALWKMATKGEAFITDVRKVKDVEEGIEYVEDYVADGFIDVGEGTEPNYEQMVEVEEALHGRRKVRAWGFDLMKGQQFGQKEESPYIWVHSYGLKISLLKESGKENLHDYWKKRREARKKGEKIPYLVLKVVEAEGLFGRSLYLLGYMRSDGLIELEPINWEDKEFWEELLIALFDYGGSIWEYVQANSLPDVDLVL